MPQAETRNFNFDVLRSCGLFLIILAHCEPPDWLYQLRDFDVPLMVIVSAATFSMIYKSQLMDYKSFYKKRIKKLIIPAWQFLTFFFITIFLGSYLLDKAYPFSQHEIITSYFFYYGIGYVWILRIFLFIALLTPPLLLFKKRVKNNYIYATIIIGIYTLYELITVQTYGSLAVNIQPGFWGSVILPIIPYAALYAYGLKLEEISNRYLIIFAALALAIFVSCLFYYYYGLGVLTGTGYLKYPPRLYYLSYAIFSVNVLYLLVKYIYPKDFLVTFWTWISANSLWIYLWHIYAIFIWNIFFNSPEKDFIISIEKFLFVCIIAILTTKFQSMCTSKIRVYLK